MNNGVWILAAALLGLGLVAWLMKEGKNVGSFQASAPYQVFSQQFSQQCGQAVCSNNGKWYPNIEQCARYCDGVGNCACKGGQDLISPQ